MNSRLLLRRLDQGAALFDRQTWQSHILSPSATAIVEHLAEHAGQQPLPAAEARRLLREDLDQDPDAPEIKALLTTLDKIGFIGE